MINIETFNERNKYTVKSSVPLATVVKKICNKLNLKYVKYVSSGSFGDVFEVSDNGIEKILKITTDREEAKIANSIKGKNIPGIIKFYEVKRIRSEELERFENYLILMDKITPITDEKTISKLNSIISKIVDDELFIIPNAINRLPNSKLKLELEIIIKSLRKIGIKEEVSDIQIQNLGLDKNNRLILFDLSIIDFSPYSTIDI
jgi:hypothetical protein